MELDVEVIIALGGLLVSGIIGVVGGVWVVERRFESKLKEVKDELKEVKDELKAEITENRNLIINYIAKEKGGYIAEDKGKYNAKAKDKKYANPTQHTKDAQLKDNK